MEVKVDKKNCVGCGACVSLCSKYFELDSEGKSKVKKEKVDPKDEKSVREAVESCPVGAISIK